MGLKAELLAKKKAEHERTEAAKKAEEERRLAELEAAKKAKEEKLRLAKLKTEEEKRQQKLKEEEANKALLPIHKKFVKKNVCNIPFSVYLLKRCKIAWRRPAFDLTELVEIMME